MPTTRTRNHLKVEVSIKNETLPKARLLYSEGVFGGSVQEIKASHALQSALLVKRILISKSAPV
jgi:hypothetical protein